MSPAMAAATFSVARIGVGRLCKRAKVSCTDRGGYVVTILSVLLSQMARREKKGFYGERSFISI